MVQLILITTLITYQQKMNYEKTGVCTKMCAYLVFFSRMDKITLYCSVTLKHIGAT